MEARATIITDSDCDYDMGVVFLYEDEEGFNGGIKALCREIFKDSVYVVYDCMGATIIPVNPIVTSRVEEDIPTVCPPPPLKKTGAAGGPLYRVGPRQSR